MPRTFPSALEGYLEQTVTDYVTIYRLTTLDGGIDLGFTTHCDNLVVGGFTYEPIDGANPTNINLQATQGISNFEILALLSSTRIKDSDVRAGRYRGAKIVQSILSPLDTTNVAVMNAGTVGQQTLAAGTWLTEFRGKEQELAVSFGDSTELYCPFEFGDSRCRLSLTGYTHSRTVSAINVAASGTTAVALLQQNCGGGAVSPYTADANYSSNGTMSTQSTSHTINTTGLVNPAPVGVYQTWRTSDHPYTLTYSLGGFTPGQKYLLRMHFCEAYWGVVESPTVGARVFSVIVNGLQLLSKFDVYANAGGDYIALIEEAVVVANASGQIVVFGDPDVAEGAMFNGLEVWTLAVAPIEITNPGIQFTGDTNPTGYYNNGTIQCTSGANAGLPPTRIKQHINVGSTAVIVPQIQFPFTVAPGDVFTLVAGCDKQPGTCAWGFNNIANFGGFPTVPGTSALVQVAR